MTLGLAVLPLAISSCKKAQEATEGAADSAKAAVADAFPTDAKGLAGLAATQMEGIATQLEGITDVESAKNALPGLEKIGGVMNKIKKSSESLGGDDAMQKLLESNPDIKSKFTAASQKIMAKMMDLGKNHPEAAKIVNEKMQAIMK